jgi:hypothetical protein
MGDVRSHRSLPLVKETLVYVMLYKCKGGHTSVYWNNAIYCTAQYSTVHVGYRPGDEKTEHLDGADKCCVLVVISYPISPI